MWIARIRAAVLALFVLSAAASSQHRIEGTVVDAETGGVLIGAHLVLDHSFTAGISDTDGGFTLDNVPAGSYILSVSYIGYESTVVKLDLRGTTALDIRMNPSPVLADEVVVIATRANADTPTAFSTVTARELRARNLGQDVPYLLDQTPSVVTTSDAGAGVGYTGLRIRGSDATRINVTINGVPLNDSESQGVYWVDLPDFVSSVENLQIQRGVGTSTNGAGAFGASLNFKTTHLDASPYARIDNTIGSFSTRKHSLSLGSGLLSERWSIDGRMSFIKSDGYIDRATADLSSYYVSAGYYGKRTTIQALTFSGHETTYQAWWGTPQSRLENDEDAMRMHALNNGYTDAQLENLLSAGRTYNHYLYENEVDDYGQDHYQLHAIHQLSPALLANAALHYTHGKGYYEQFREGDDLADYGLAPLEIGSEPIEESDFIRRRWLDNDFYGATYNLLYSSEPAEITLGGAYNYYDGGHFGEVIWAGYAGDIDSSDRYYDNTGKKTDTNVFAKAKLAVSGRLILFGDMQFRGVGYSVAGIDNDQRNLSIDESFVFFNPKAGLTWILAPSARLYASYSVGNREPVRDDFIDAPQGRSPEHETLRDTEIGFRYARHRFRVDMNLYLMDYRNQLVLTGELNDVGAPIRTNVENSYRSGVELQLGWQPTRTLRWTANLALSRNRIDRFSETLYDYSSGYDVRVNEHENTDISFSPGLVASSTLGWSPLEGLDVRFMTKAVGKQYLDNTSNEARAMDPYLVNDLGITYSFQVPRVRSIDVNLLVSNLLNASYVSNGYTYSYIYGDLITENFYYPQAGRHVLAGVSIGF